MILTTHISFGHSIPTHCLSMDSIVYPRTVCPLAKIFRHHDDIRSHTLKLNIVLGQKPFIFGYSCYDGRVGPETIFEVENRLLFNVRQQMVPSKSSCTPNINPNVINNVIFYLSLYLI